MAAWAASAEDNKIMPARMSFLLLELSHTLKPASQ
jgi:hypothetical protein